jgi:hypothetical protein
MKIPFARHITLAVAALAITTTSLIAPSSAAAANVPAQQAAVEDAQTITIHPDVKVEALPMQVVNGKVWYMWKVTNVSLATAKGIQLTRYAKLWTFYNGCCRGTIGDTYMHIGDLGHNESFGVMLECPGYKHYIYCDEAYLKVKLTQGGTEVKTSNNISYQGSTRDMHP